MTRITSYPSENFIRAFRETPIISRHQLELDSLSQQFSGELCNAQAMGGFLMGSMAFHSTRLLTFQGLRIFRPLLSRALSNIGGFLGEASALQAFHHLTSPQTNSSWLSQFVQVACLRSLPALFGRENVFIQHLVTDLSLLGAQHLVNTLEDKTPSTPSFWQALFSAEISNLQFGFSQSLAHRLLGARLSRLERQLERNIHTSLHCNTERNPSHPLLQMSNDRSAPIDPRTLTQYHAWVHLIENRGNEEALTQLLLVGQESNPNLTARETARALIQHLNPRTHVGRAQTDFKACVSLVALASVGNAQAARALRTLDARNYAESFGNNPLGFLPLVMAGIYGLPHYEQLLIEKGFIGESFEPFRDRFRTPEHPPTRALIILDALYRRAPSPPLGTSIGTMLRSRYLDPAGDFVSAAQSDAKVFQAVAEILSTYQSESLRPWAQNLDLPSLSANTPAGRDFANSLADLLVMNASEHALEVLRTRAETGDIYCAFNLARLRNEGLPRIVETLQRLNPQAMIQSQYVRPHPNLFEFLCLCAHEGNEYARGWLDTIRTPENTALIEVHRRRFVHYEQRAALRKQMQHETPEIWEQLGPHDALIGIIACLEAWAATTPANRERYRQRARNLALNISPIEGVPPGNFVREFFHQPVSSSTGMRTHLEIYAPLFDQYQIPSEKRPPILLEIMDAIQTKEDFNMEDVIRIMKQHQNPQDTNETFMRKERPRSRRR